jgi:pyruvate carboxylase
LAKVEEGVTKTIEKIEVVSSQTALHRGIHIQTMPLGILKKK